MVLLLTALTALVGSSPSALRTASGAMFGAPATPSPKSNVCYVALDCRSCLAHEEDRTDDETQCAWCTSSESCVSNDATCVSGLNRDLAHCPKPDDRVTSVLILSATLVGLAVLAYGICKARHAYGAGTGWAKGGFRRRTDEEVQRRALLDADAARQARDATVGGKGEYKPPSVPGEPEQERPKRGFKFGSARSKSRD